MQMLSAAILFVAATLLAASAARAQDIEAGKRVAQSACSSCHLVDPAGQNSGSDAVPTFAAIARMPSTTEISLVAFLSAPHAPMPELILNRAEIQDVSVYILSLRNLR
jgi:mono/diheme cytochrome c family protein